MTPAATRAATWDAAALEPFVVAAARGDQAAFARLVDATGGVVCAIALAVVGDVAESEDVAQDVYLAVWRDLRKLRNPASFLPWLRQLTRHRAHHVLRSTVRRRRRVTLADADALLAAAADPAPLPPDRLVAEEEARALAAALAELPDAAREVVVLYYREGRSVRQVAELLGLSQDVVKQRLARARARVRAALLERAGDALRATAPTAALTAAVLSALSLAAPSAAAATLVAGTVAGKAAGVKLAGKAGATTLGGLTTGAALGVGGGLLGGLLGVWGGARPLYRRARDDAERRGVLAYGIVCSLGLVGFMATIVVAPRPLPVTVAFALLEALLAGLHFAWLPRVTARRRAAELIEDPVGAAAAHARQRRQARLGFLVGSVLGWLPIVWAWLR